MERTSRELHFDIKIIDFTQSIEKVQMCNSGSFFIAKRYAARAVVSQSTAEQRHVETFPMVNKCVIACASM